MALFNLVDQASNYGAYHNNTIAIIFLNYLAIPDAIVPLVTKLNTLSPYLPLTIGTPIAIVLSLYYCILNVQVGLVATAWIMAANYLAVYTEQQLGADTLKFALIVHIASWVFQFIGHGAFEGRRPALLDNIFQVFIAPFFVTLELLFAFGLMSKTRVAVDRNIIQKIQSIKKNK
ncbi:hypothetical protein DFA_11191 [Cavenderia fasciculata]|uniref:Transmembrane protein n=1 Tax=Cavenderia fasciculata TaxID=261658 RepID=F4QFC3_CACFS|nr:uncharacterized protein DFA_11191 [Cavenderia fasciculata]EGG13430.1 hypothetical protein DFA_11191 [Cavenderia fasciculata]|eukprot:XP_004350134.1 hypothetical protein DFA_11191 [Cavenderia fasciculata]